MRRSLFSLTGVVKILTLACIFLVSGCSYIDQRYGEYCNSHAYVHSTLPDFISSRFHSQAPVRIGVIPFSVPANLSVYSNERPGLGNELAWKIQAQLLATEVIPIVEVLNRQDWPGKREEFFTGNFGAIAVARETDYDLVLVGLLNNLTSNDQLGAYTKLIEVESGITVWYGKTTVNTRRQDFQEARAMFGIERYRPDLLYIDSQIEKLAQCIAQDVAPEQVR